MRLRRAASVALALMLVGIGGCEDDVRGPGTLDLRVSASVPLGAAVVEVVGEGVTGVEQPATGWVELVPVAPQGDTPVHRLVVIQEQVGVLAVRLRVTDVETVRPTVTVIEASDGNDQALASPASVRATIER